MNSKVKKLPQSKVELTFSLDPKELEEERSKAVEKLAQNVKVPGFRPGKAPKQMVEERIDPSAAMQQALDVLLNKTYQEALKEHDLVPVAQPEVTLDSMDLSKPIPVKTVVQVRPEAKVGDYTKIKAKKEVEVINEDRLNQTLQTIFERSTEAKKGEGEHEAGELVDANGQPLSKDKPEAQMDDAWAKSLGAKDLEDLRARVKSDLEGQAEYEAQQKWQDDVVTKLIEMTKVELPEAFIEDEISRMRAHFEQQLQGMGITLDDYVKQAGKSLDELEEQWKPQAEKQAALEVALGEIARKEDIQVEESEVDEELAKVDEQTRSQFDDPQQRYYLTYTMWRQKILKHVLDAVEKANK